MLLSSHPYNNPVPIGESEVGAELPPLIISNIVVFIIAGTIVVGVGMSMALDHWWPWVASAVACFILVKTA